MDYNISPARDSVGPLLICHLTTDTQKTKAFVLCPRDTGRLVLWVSKWHGEENEFIPVAETFLDEIQRDSQRWLPEAEVQLVTD